MLSRSTRALALCLSALAAAPAAAQEASPEDARMASELFRSGLEASRAERWQEARIDFERAYELVPRASYLLNLAAAQAALGQVVEASASYRRFIEQATSGRALEFREQAERSLAEAEARIARVTITVDDLRPDDVLLVDDAETPTDTIGEPMDMNPGEHVLVVRRYDQEAGRVELLLVEGESRGVEMRLTDVAPPEAVAPDPGSGGGGEDLVESPWLWLGVGAGVVVLAVVIGVAVGLSTQGGPPLFMGNVGTGAVTFE